MPINYCIAGGVRAVDKTIALKINFCVNINFIYDYYRKKIPKFYYNKFSQECLIKGFCLATYILKMCQNLTKVII